MTRTSLDPASLWPRVYPHRPRVRHRHGISLTAGPDHHPVHHARQPRVPRDALASPARCGGGSGFREIRYRHRADPARPSRPSRVRRPCLQACTGLYRGLEALASRPVHGPPAAVPQAHAAAQDTPIRPPAPGCTGPPSGRGPRSGSPAPRPPAAPRSGPCSNTLFGGGAVHSEYPMRVT